MFLFHPRITQLINARSLYTPFAADGLNGSTGQLLLTQQSNRLLAFGHQSLASSGGTASLCGGAAGPGGGPAGACGGAFSGSPFVVAGGSNGACGGVPVGGQEIGRFYFDGSVTRVSPLNLDNVEEVEPLPAPGFGGGSLLRTSLIALPPGGREDGLGSVGGVDTSNMYLIANHLGKSRDDRNKGGGKTCPHPPNSTSK